MILITSPRSSIFWTKRLALFLPMTLSGLLLISLFNLNGRETLHLLQDVESGLFIAPPRKLTITPDGGGAPPPCLRHDETTTKNGCDDETKCLTISSSSSLSSSEEKEEENDTYTLVVVCCRANIAWLSQVPLDWRIVVYDKCERNNHDSLLTKVNPTTTTISSRKNLLRHTVTNQGWEECNGYLDYMHDYYDNHTTVTVFMHDDGLWPYSTHQGWDAHTAFQTFDPIVNATKQFVTKDHPFLHLGVTTFGEQWGKQSYHGAAMKILWPYFAKVDPHSHPPVVRLDPPPTNFTFKPSAHFAVRKEQLLIRPKATYYAMLQQFRFAGKVNGRDNKYMRARQFCCAMERMWHIFFGEPAILPKRAMAMELLNITHPRFTFTYAPLPVVGN
jgi:Protein of unknown function (DUF3431)